MSWTDSLTPWAAEPAPAPPLQILVLAALSQVKDTLREAAGHCADCERGQACADHEGSLELAGQYEAAYMRIRGIGSDGAMLTLTGGLT